MRTADRGEFEQVFRSGYPSVLKTAYFVLHDRGRAEEVTQDGFLRLYQRWPQAVSYDHPVAWVRKVVVRDAIRRAERERRQQPTFVLLDRATTDRVPDLDLLAALASCRRGSGRLWRSSTWRTGPWTRSPTSCR